MRKKYTQTQARAMYQKIQELEVERTKMFSAWSHNYPYGTHITGLTLTKDHPFNIAVNTARRLGHACVVTNNGAEIFVYALPDVGTRP
jgi:hypothetical protein